MATAELPFTTKPLRQEAVDKIVGGELEDVTSLGKGITVLKDETVLLDEKFADKFLELTPFESERNLDSNWVGYLDKAMQRGTFRPEQVSLTTAVCPELGDSIIRMNGQHTCHAARQSGKKFKVRRVHYRCATVYDLRQLYASLDRGKSRTAGHVAISYLDGSDIGKFGRYITPMLLNGMTAFAYPAEPRRGDVDERCYRLLDEFKPLAMKVGRFLQSHQEHDARRYYRKASVGAMFATFKKNAKAAEAFWTQVVTGVGIGKKSPVLQLQSYLLRLRNPTGRQRDRLRAPDEEIYRACLLAWNAWRDGRTLPALKPGSLKERPAVH